MTDLASMDVLVSLAKRRGFVFQSSEIYGGLGSVWDYGPLGVELKKNLTERWWRSSPIASLEPETFGMISRAHSTMPMSFS